jgi:hypothetical protein
MRYALPFFAVLAAVPLVFYAGEAPAQECPANVPHIDGVWTTLPYPAPINPLSTTLLHTGKVLVVAGSENDASNSPDSQSYRAAVWDPTGTTEDSFAVQNIASDVFCSGTAVLPDGRSLTVGGTSSYGFTGDNRASFFDPATLRFTQAQSMVDGRWYATATALGDGRIMAWSGLDSSGGTNASVEIYDLRDAGAGWTAPILGEPTPQLFPRLSLLPDGTVFYNGQGALSSSDPHSWIFDPVRATWTASAATTTDRTNGSAVLLPLLPPRYTPRVMNFGGGDPATSSTEVIDLSAPSPAWTPGPPMSTGRCHMNAVLLPDGKVLAEGGSVKNEIPDAPGRHADLYDPSSNTFASGGTATYSRLYHSTALLLPDATVASLGSNPGDRGSYQSTIEIYRPAYLYDADDNLVTNRLRITGVSPSGPLGYGSPVFISYWNTSPTMPAPTVASAVLIRPGSTTHASDMEQRLVGLCGASPQPACSTSGGTLSLTMPPNGNLAPPGYYMLFLIDTAGVPSHGQFVQLTPYTSTPPRGAIVAPPSCPITVNAGDSVSFSARPSILTPSSSWVFPGASAQPSILPPSSSWVFPGGSPATSTAQSPGAVTFATPGEYVVSLTEIDGSGNSDPSPPTCPVKVLPTSPDFEIDVSPPAQAIVPGQSATFRVSITALGSFSREVTLSVASESGFPGGIASSGFSPSAITPAGTSILTMSTTTSASPYALSLTVTGTSGSLSHTASTTLVVLIDAPPSLQATAGDGQATLTWPDVPAATGYHVKRSTIRGGPYLSVGCPASSTFTDTGLVVGTTYYYVVSAFFTGGTDDGGESADSPEASVTPGGSTTTTLGVSEASVDFAPRAGWCFIGCGATTM